MLPSLLARARRHAPAALLVTAALVMGAAGGAVAGGLVTGKQIKDGTVTTADVKDKTLTTKDFARTTRSKLRGPAGAPGPTGATGATGAQGPAGPAGADGADGLPGLDGVDGLDGADGLPGVDGIDGIDGVSGFEVVSATSTSVLAGVLATATATCPGQKVAIGHTASWGSSLTAPLVEQVDPSDLTPNALTATGLNPGLLGDTLNLKLYCVRVY